MTNDDILLIVKQKFDPPVDNTKILLAIEEVCQIVKNYCQIRTIPSELRFTIANIVNDGLKETPGKDITSLKMGDMSIQLGSNSDYKRITSNYQSQLNLFRRLW